MKLMRRILLKEFLPFFFLGIFFFSLVLVLGDFFTNSWRYLNRDVPFSQTLLISLLYAPRAMGFALPIGSMFAAAFALGNLGSRNELIAIFGAGVPLRRFVLPMLLIAVVSSIGGFYLEDRVAIPMMKQRNLLSDELMGIQDSKNRSRAVAIADEGRTIYYSDYYNDEKTTLTGLTVVLLNEENSFRKRIDAERATWDDEGLWILEGCRVYRLMQNGEVVQDSYDRYRDEEVNEEPSTFRLDTRKLDEMNGADARLWIATQRKAGLPYRKLQAEFYQRYTLALTPFLVVLFAGSLGGRFKRNVLLMSLLASLLLSSSWYVVRMISTLFSESGVISPMMGAVIPYMGFLALGAWLFRHAKT